MLRATGPQEVDAPVWRRPGWGDQEPVGLALTTSSSVASATAGCTGRSVARFAVDRRVRECVPIYPRITRQLQGVNPINPPSPDVLVARSSDRCLTTVDGVVWIHSGPPEHPCFALCGSFSSSLQPGKSIPLLSQFFPGSLAVVTWPKRACFAQDEMIHLIHQGIPPRVGVGND